MISVEDRILADRAWRSPEKRRLFEAETGLIDEGAEEYQSRFIEWALSVSRPDRGGQP